MAIDPAEIVRQLERVLASGVFAGAARHRRLLRYVVERTLAGDGDQLKEYVLGTEVFDRPDSYDPRLDTIVRVEARRLRARLDEYYRGPGADDPIVIGVPRGSYVPEFHPRATRVAPPAPRGTSATGATRRRSVAVWVIAPVLFTAVLLGVARVLPGRGTPAAAASSPAIAVLPFEAYSVDPEHAAVAAKLTDAVTSALVRGGTVAVASRTSAWQYAGRRTPAPEIGRALNVQYLAEASIDRRSDALSLTLRLVDVAADRKVWAREYTQALPDLPRLAQVAAGDLAAAAVAHHGK